MDKQKIQNEMRLKDFLPGLVLVSCIYQLPTENTHITIKDTHTQHTYQTITDQLIEVSVFENFSKM